MNPLPQSRRALITGGSRGLGAAIAAELTRRGVQVIAPDRATLDLADPASLDAYLATRTSTEIDILINNAGINVLQGLPTLEPSVWQAMLQVNLTSALRLIQSFAPGMAARGWGRVVNLSTQTLRPVKFANVFNHHPHFHRSRHRFQPPPSLGHWTEYLFRASIREFPN